MSDKPTQVPRFTQRSYNSLVQQADPDRDRIPPIVYVFSQGRKFRDHKDPYKNFPGKQNGTGSS